MGKVRDIREIYTEEEVKVLAAALRKSREDYAAGRCMSLQQMYDVLERQMSAEKNKPTSKPAEGGN